MTFKLFYFRIFEIFKGLNKIHFLKEINQKKINVFCFYT